MDVKIILLLSSLFVSGFRNVASLPPRPSFLLRSKSSGGNEASLLNQSPTRKLQRPYAKVAKWSLRKDLLQQCAEKWRNATLDHFTTVPPAGDLSTFPQRYFVCANHWQRHGPNGSNGPIFFYLGNEADVTLYLNNTGLMWESAPDFGAMLVFAEHRYYGESVPYGKNVKKHMGYLTAEQAMADYAEIIHEIKDEYDAHESAVIGFGGSYGGMLATWMRLKYPHALDGSIAASAPIWNFLGEVPAFDPGSFAKGVTYDASELAGSAPACVDNVRDTWDLLKIYGGDADGRKFLAEGLRLCPSVKLKGEDEVLYLRDWLGAAWDYMAMGNYPYPSSYITNGHGQLPAFPVRVACDELDSDSLSDSELLDAMAAAVGVFYNHTGEQACFDPFAGTDPDSDHDADWWGFQWCAEMLMPFSKSGADDMFWSDPFDLDASIAACQQQWGVTPRPLWATIEWGGRRISAGSNIVFSNGLLDPWHGGGVLEDLSDSMPAVIIPEGAHHLDLMFSHPDDPLSVIEVRKFQRESIRDWIDLAALSRQRQKQQQQQQQNPQNQQQFSPHGSSQSLKLRRDGSKHAPTLTRVGADTGHGCVATRLWRAAGDWLAGALGWWGRVLQHSRPAAGQLPHEQGQGGRSFGHAGSSGGMGRRSGSGGGAHGGAGVL